MNTGRIAKCSTCKRERSSSEFSQLAFFIFRGEGSEAATKLCKCGFHEVAHGEINKSTGRAGITNHDFDPHGVWDYDLFYCGCRGWD